MKKIFGTAMVLTVSAILAAVPVYADGLVFDPETYNSTVDVSHPYAGQPAAQKTANSTAKTTSSVVVPLKAYSGLRFNIVVITSIKSSLPLAASR